MSERTATETLAPTLQVTSKPWYESISIWGAAVGIVGTALGFFNIILTPEVQAVVVDGAVKVAAGITAKDWGAVLSGIVALGGAIMSIVGRKQADQPVHFIAPFTVTTVAPISKAPGGVQPVLPSKAPTAPAANPG